MSETGNNKAGNDLIRNVPRGRDGFDVPEGYFDALPDMVMARVEDDKKVRPSTGARIRHLALRPALAYAAIICGLLIAAVALLDTPRPTDAFAGITDEEAYAYVYSNIDEYSINDMLSIADDPFIDEEITDLSEDQVNIALDALINDFDPEELDELF